MDVVHFMQQLPFPYKVYLNVQSLQFPDVPFTNGDYSVAPHLIWNKEVTFHKITSSSQITSDSSIFTSY